jgi:hypothetical protein
MTGEGRVMSSTRGAMPYGLSSGSRLEAPAIVNLASR